MSVAPELLHVEGYCFDYDEPGGAQLYGAAIGEDGKLDVFAMRFGNMQSADVFVARHVTHEPPTTLEETALVSALEKELKRRDLSQGDMDSVQYLTQLSLRQVLLSYLQASRGENTPVATVADRPRQD